MGQVANVFTKPLVQIDYSLIGVNSNAAVEKGLAEAEWYQCPVPRETMRKLLERRDGPAIRHTLLWFALLFATGYATYRLWGSWWAILPYAVYAVLYATVSDSRWHEAGHGTAFKTDWMNVVLYEIASFMIVRESTPWRWSHTRHHSDTIIVGRDPEIAVPRPTNVSKFIQTFFCIPAYTAYFKTLIPHVFGIKTATEATYIPDSEWSKVYWKARVHFAIYLASIALSIYTRSFLPILLVGATNLFGTWLTVTYGMTQHAGLAENVLDHRLNCRTVYMNPVHRYLYWNMNYHVEHHMFPLVPFHALPKLHEAIKDDCPPPYTSIFNAWREIIPAILRQIHDPAWHVKRVLPPAKVRSREATHVATGSPDAEGWMDVCAASELRNADALRFDYGRKTFAIYRDAEGRLFASDGICTHGNTHLADGLVIGGTIECPKHNGRFHLIDGSPARAPICRGLATYPVEEIDGRLRINVIHAGGAGAREQKSFRLRVLSNRSVATFIKELVLEPVVEGDRVAFEPGDYLQIEIPAYETIRFRDFDIPEPYRSVWEAQHLFDLETHNPNGGTRNNYSLASNALTERALRFNVRIATPPPGQQCAPGVGSSYIFSLKPGDVVNAIGPFGDFHIKPTQREMIYIGGGAGMAPLRAHLANLLENERTARRVSFWYGARSKQELFYEDYFEELATQYPNFHFHVALSSPLESDTWDGHTGFIHDVVLEKHLREHASPASAEYYLCGPPMMIKACTRMLAEAGVPEHQIAFDEF
ncbi:MAG: NADH:ubiquinone reductase (Na(+)-transporting) subunit F [Acidobacteria bacterium]|nr:NADH:ubiquinone reductase (Na(+)-transporting) subunit F [Acidobacteriota bacterium]